MSTVPELGWMDIMTSLPLLSHLTLSDPDGQDARLEYPMNGLIDLGASSWRTRRRGKIESMSSR
jgi:hypothetical protein